VDAVDTSILIWGVKRESPPDRPDMVSRCVALIESLKGKRSVIMIPSIVVAEYLADFPLERQAEQRQIFGHHFFIAPFDARAATIAGEIYSKTTIHQAQSDTGICRQCLKADLKIIATAIAHGAARIYTNDKHFTKLACGRIIVEGIPLLAAFERLQASPSQSQQTKLFGDSP
jgi:predicted nucleic acid-binding protein